MGKGDDRFDAIFQQLVKQVVIKLQARLVRLLLIAFGEDTRLGSGGAKAFKAHLRKQRDILFVMRIELDRLMVR